MTPVEDDLRRLFNDPRRDVPAWPDASERIRHGMRRRHRRQVVIGAASATVTTLVAVAVAVGIVRGPLSSPDVPIGSPSPSASAIPWRDLPPVEYSGAGLDIRPIATACTAADLTLDGVSTGAAMGTQYHSIKVRDAGATRCTLAGRPELLFTGAGATRTAQTSPVTYFGAAPNSIPATIDAGEPAWLDVQTYGGCFTSANQAHIILDDIALRLPDGSTLPLRSTVDATCGVGMSEWFRPTPEQPPLPWVGLTITITAPTTAKLGQTLEYVVELTNSSDVAVALTPCPNYTQTLTGPGTPLKGGAVGQLNCAVATIPAHSRVRFDMHLAIPNGPVPDGPVSLRWALDPGQADEPMPSATVSVTLVP